MKKILYITLFASLMTTSCVAGPEHPGTERILVQPLPAMVVLEIEPYYYFRGYHYHYINNRWYYSLSKKGPWRDLPFDRYPTEIRFKDRANDQPHYWNREYSRYEDHGRGKEQQREHVRDRDYQDASRWQDRETDDGEHEQLREHSRKSRRERD